MTDKEDRTGTHPDVARRDADGDAAWDTAWAWVRREHEHRDFDDDARRDLRLWLEADASHRSAYARACKLWLLTGFVPPVNDVPTPGLDDTDPR
ncbi:MAG: DUF4880 domain-containing protein [Acidovorax sp.]